MRQSVRIWRMVQTDLHVCATRWALLCVTLIIAAEPVRAQQTDLPVHLIPLPESVTPGVGEYILTDPVRIVLSEPSERLSEVAGFLSQVIWLRTGFRVAVESGRGTGSIIVLDEHGARPNDEGYELTVAPGEVRISAATPEGVFWGVQTLRQLLPPGFEDSSGARRPSWSIAAVEIVDNPRFAWRGSLLDVGRHFFPVDFVKRYIDLLSRYKMNVLHWHLTEDQGWRIEIPEYPRLTEVGAWRTEADGSTYGGYYTQAEIREVVEYARRRNVTVVPEIEMPGHAQAAIASYPELGCTGEPVPVAITWGVMKEIYCVGNERTFTFLEDVLDEVMALFPSRYIHIGGDEVPKDRWKSCASCQALMKREGLKDEAELQSWFVRRIERYLDRHGRKLIGWDEILEGGLPGRATVQVWRDTAHVTTAVRLGNAVIVSPTSHAYLDASPSSIPLERVYGFNPVPDGLDSVEAGLVLGGEANLWTEHITTANFDLMAFPRLLAMSEALWSGAPRDYQGFLERLRGGHYPRLRALYVDLGPEDRDVVRLTISYDSAAGAASVDVEKNVAGLVVRFTTDGSQPSAASPEYDESIRFSDPGTVTVQPFLREEPLPVWRTFTVVEHIARGKPVILATAHSNQYPGTGTTTLTDGLLGSTNHHDGLWQGWIGSDLEAVIDLGEKRSVHSIGASFLQATGSWILFPKSVAIDFSDDGVRWRPVAELTHDVPADRDAPLRRVVEHELGGGSEARFVRIVAKNPGALPDWHPGAGRPSWIFADEIIVR